ncbi:transcription factor atoh8 [Phlebotomus papatasi]|uniref:transcription factor atoh8 n=1 Tax=Phlebotomus papatasi TaxID=29031 RepID=UPI0024839401|nr:transcription factor atoh8 [Phlebotomus papatasi]
MTTARPSDPTYAKLTAAELSALFLKGASMSSLMERDAGFCSGSSENEDDTLTDHAQAPRSPTDASEDSVEVKVTPICLPKNKRKSSEPLRCVSESELGPIKKRIRYEEKMKETEVKTDAKNPFRPWASVAANGDCVPCPPPVDPAEIFRRHPAVTTLHRAPETEDDQVEPLALVAKKTSSEKTQTVTSTSARRIKQEAEDSSSGSYAAGSSSGGKNSQAQQRNYKNMTRERRIEANARERTRVHTISAAFDTLRRAIPSYSHTQKLSKLSVLRIACSYILTLSRVAGMDYSQDGSEPSIDDCVDLVTKTIQTEGKLRKKKDE